MIRFAGEILVAVGNGPVRLEQGPQRAEEWDGGEGCMSHLRAKPQGTM